MQPMSLSMLNTPEAMEPSQILYKLRISSKIPVNILFVKSPSESHIGSKLSGIVIADSVGTEQEEDTAAIGATTPSGRRPTLLRLPIAPMLIGIYKLKKFLKQEKPNQETGEK